MVLYLPTFNLVASVWNTGNTPSGGPADATDIPCQLFIASKISTDMEYGTPWAWNPAILVRLPISENAAANSGQIFEIPQGSARYYRKRWVDVIHQGFANEYWCALVVQCDNTGVDVARDVF